MFLATNPIIKGKGNYTIQRLGISKRTQYWMIVTADMIYFLFDWVVRALALLIRLSIMESQEQIALPGSLGKFYSIVSAGNDLFLIPLEAPELFAVRLFLLFLISLVLANITTRELEKRTA